MKNEIKKYLELKAQIRRLTSEAGKLGDSIREGLGIEKGQRLEKDGYSISYQPTRRWTMVKGRNKGLAGFIKRKFSDEIMWSLIRFDYKDLSFLKDKYPNDMNEFFECKETHSLRIKEVTQ